jgi:hypothetical protein
MSIGQGLGLARGRGCAGNGERAERSELNWSGFQGPAEGRRARGGHVLGRTDVGSGYDVVGREGI